MNKHEYKAARQARGTQNEVAELLDVRQATISDRESGKAEISREAELALMSLPRVRLQEWNRPKTKKPKFTLKRFLGPNAHDSKKGKQ